MPWPAWALASHVKVEPLVETSVVGTSTSGPPIGPTRNTLSAAAPAIEIGTSGWRTCDDTPLQVTAPLLATL